MGWPNSLKKMEQTISQNWVDMSRMPPDTPTWNTSSTNPKNVVEVGLSPMCCHAWKLTNVDPYILSNGGASCPSLVSCWDIPSKCWPDLVVDRPHNPHTLMRKGVSGGGGWWDSGILVLGLGCNSLLGIPSRLTFQCFCIQMACFSRVEGRNLTLVQFGGDVPNQTLGHSRFACPMLLCSTYMFIRGRKQNSDFYATLGKCAKSDYVFLLCILICNLGN